LVPGEASELVSLVGWLASPTLDLDDYRRAASPQGKTEVHRPGEPVRGKTKNRGPPLCARL
jgi:hypothetical protein